MKKYWNYLKIIRYSFLSGALWYYGVLDEFFSYPDHHNITEKLKYLNSVQDHFEELVYLESAVVMGWASP